MSFDYKLFDFLQSIPKDTKEEIIYSIYEVPNFDRGSAAKNAKIMYQWLKKHDYQKPHQDYSVEHIKEFISKTLYGEYFPECIPKYYNEDELKQLELMRDAIDQRIKELQEEQFNNDIWEHQQRRIME